MEDNWLEDAYDQMELLGFPLYSYFDLISEKMLSNTRAKHMPDYLNKKILLYGILVNTRFNTTKNNTNMRFSTFIDQNGNYFDVVHFTNVVDKYPIYGIGVYACYGKVTEEFGHFSLEAIWTRKISLRADPRVSNEPSFENVSDFRGRG